jgi:hypothetical protein
MKKQTPQFKLIQGGKKESKHSVRLDVFLILLGILLVAIIVYKATYYEY